MDRAPLETGFTRAVLAALALSHAVSAWATFYLPYVRWPYIWATIFVLAAVGAAHCAISFHFKPLVFCAALTVTAFASRGGVLIVAWMAGSRSLAEMIQGLATWWGFCLIGWGTIFLRGAIPLAASHDKGE